ncbi:MAG: autotransporter-associated beta strand repeat-containing protein [Verrucomicrobiota bacterium]
MRPFSISTVLRHRSARLLVTLLLLMSSTGPLLAQRQMEKLGRGLVVLHSATSQAYLSWRLLVTDPEGIGFNVYRSANGAPGVKLNISPLTTTTDYQDTTANFTVSNAWYVVPVTNGVEGSPSAAYALATNSPVRQYVSLPLINPGAFAPYDVKFSWFGDFDGDGEYDYLVDRLSTTAGMNQFLQAYKRDGTFLWQIDMGPLSDDTSNTYEPAAAAISVGDKDNVTVYDLDGDGRAEVIVRTANGTMFANGSVVTTNNNTAQFLSIIDGLTGLEKARAVIPNPYFADGPLNMHAGIAYLDGIHPSIIYSGENRVGSGNFQRLTIAWDYRNGQLTQRWVYQTPNGQNDSEGHQLRIADVNHDGKDDIIRIGSVITELTNGIPTTLYSTELVHGDRHHVTDIDPERPGLEMYAIQQLNQTLLATSLQDMASGVLFKKWYSPGIVDVGRGIALDMTSTTRGCEVYSTQPGIFDAKGNQIYVNNLWAPEGLWWDGDLLREFEDGAGSGALSPVVNKFNPATGGADRIYTLYNEDGGCHQAYGGRAAVWGDLFGDWREEFMVVANDYNSVRIYTTKIPAANRLYCLMQNPQYRVQCTFKGYYQASYVDYYLGTDMSLPVVPPVSDAKLVWRGGPSNVWDEAATANWFTNNLWISNTTAVTFTSGHTVLFDMTGSNQTAVTLAGSLAPGDVRIHSPKNYVFDGPGKLTGGMKLTKGGAGKLTFNGTNTYTGATKIDEGTFIVNGSLPYSPVTVRGGAWLDGRLGGTGVIGSFVRFEEGGGLSPGAGTNSPGTLTINSNVIFVTRTYSDFDLSDDPTGTFKTNDLVNINGSLTLQAVNKFNIRKLNATLPPGVYPLINYSGTLTGSVANITITGLPGIPLALTNPPGQIALVVKSFRPPASITWTGSFGSSTWDLLTSSNFLNGIAQDQFAPFDNVRFDNSGSSHSSVNLSGDLNAGAVVVDSTVNYTFSGSGGIIGSASLTKSNSGTLTISALNNSFTGKTTIAGGTVVVSELDAVGYPSPLGSPPGGSTNLILSGGSTLRITGESYTDRGMTLNAGQNTLDIFNAADQVTIAGQIVGGGTLVKTGAGALALNVANTFSGGVIISNGSVSLGSVAGNQTGVGTGSVTLYNGTLSMINIQASETAAWPLIVPAGATGRLNCDGRCTLTGSLTGGGTFTVMTPYVRTDFSGNWSAFTNQINIVADSDGGDFRCNNSAGYPGAKINLAAQVSFQNRLSGTPTISIGELSGSAGSSISAPGGNGGVGVTWSVGGLNTSATFAGNTYNGVNFIKVGTGAWTWTGTNISHSGTFTINGGSLLMNANAAAAAGAVTVGGAGTLGGTGKIGGTVTVNGTLTGTLTINAPVTVNGTLAPGNGGIGTLTVNSSLAFGAGGRAFMKINKTAGTRDLAIGTNGLTYRGTLQVTNLAGTLAAGDTFKIFDAPVYGQAFTNFILPALNPGLAWQTIGLFTNGSISVVSSGALPPAPSAPTNLTIVSATFSQVGLAWNDTATNESSFLIERSTDNTNFTQVGSTIANVVSATDAGLSPSTLFYYRVRASNAGGSSAYSNVAFTNTPSGPTTLVWRGDGSGNVWDVGTTANWRNAGVASVFADGSAAVFDDSGSNNISVSLSGLISPNAVTITAAKNYTFAGTGALTNGATVTKTGTGSLTISAAQAYSGGTFVSAGTLSITAGGSVGSGGITFSNTAGFTLGGSSVFISPAVTLAEGATVTMNSGNLANGYGGSMSSLDNQATLIIAGPVSFSAANLKQLQGFTGTVQINSGAQLRYSTTSGVNDGGDFAKFVVNGTLNTRNGGAVACGSLSGTGSVAGAGNADGNTTFTIGGAGVDSAFFGNIFDANAVRAVGLVKTGAGTLTLAGTNSYSLQTTISGGALQIGDGNGTGTLPTNNIVNNAALIFNRSNSITDGTGIISGSGSVTQDGDGVVTFARSHTYSGPTLINSGTLALAGSGSFANSSSVAIASGATLDVSVRTGGSLTLNSGKTLTGSGSVKGNFTLANGARLNPGSPLGTLTFSNSLTLAGGSLTTLELFQLPGAHDRVDVLETLLCGGSLVVTNVGTNVFTAGSSFPLLNAAVLSGWFTNVTLPPLAPGLTWDTNTLVATGTLTVLGAEPPVFNTVTTLADGNFRLNFSGPAGSAYELRASTNLALLPVTLWDLVQSGTFGNAPVEFNDLSATNHPSRFYLLRLP